MKKLKATLLLFALAIFLMPNSINAGATCAPCGDGMSLTCPDDPNGTACGFWFEAPGVAAVQCHPSGRTSILDCGEGDNEQIDDSL